jgi:Trk K+ transport system NAD-binding subunit
MQILMFLVLGLLVYPSELPAIAPKALLLSLFLMLIARPVAVAIALWRSEFSWRERTLVAWTGLRGAVPIVLATFPLLAGYEESVLVFDIVFFTVLSSVLIQGTLLMPVARLLQVDEPLASRPRFSFALERLGQAQGETREIEILPNMAAAGKTVWDLGIPSDVLILLIGRGEGYVVPRGQTRIEPYDSLLLIGEPEGLRIAVYQIVSPKQLPPKDISDSDPLGVLPATTEDKYLSGHVVIVGYGRVGRRIGEALAREGVPFVVADQDREVVEKLRLQGRPAVLGDASTAMVLAQAHVLRARVLVVATPDTMKVRKTAEIARALNPEVHIVIRSHSDTDATLLIMEGAGTVFLGEHELANSIVDHVLARMLKG